MGIAQTVYSPQRRGMVVCFRGCIHVNVDIQEEHEELLMVLAETGEGEEGAEEEGDGVDATEDTGDADGE